jgi:hypothetical protein
MIKLISREVISPPGLSKTKDYSALQVQLCFGKKDARHY